MRLAMVDRLLVACKEAAIPQILKIHFETPREAPGTPEEPEEAPAERQEEGRRRSSRRRPRPWKGCCNSPCACGYRA